MRPQQRIPVGFGRYLLCLSVSMHRVLVAFCIHLHAEQLSAFHGKINVSRLGHLSKFKREKAYGGHD